MKVLDNKLIYIFKISIIYLVKERRDSLILYHFIID